MRVSFAGLTFCAVKERYGRESASARVMVEEAAAAAVTDAKYMKEAEAAARRQAREKERQEAMEKARLQAQREEEAEARRAARTAKAAGRIRLLTPSGDLVITESGNASLRAGSPAPSKMESINDVGFQTVSSRGGARQGARRPRRGGQL